jgi:hypothetical protein
VLLSYGKSYLGKFLDYRFGFLYFLVHCDNIDDFGMGWHFGGVGTARAMRRESKVDFISVLK